MNIKRILGFACMLLAFLVPFQFSMLNVDDMNNAVGVLGFLGFMALLFAGYALVDSSYPQPEAVESDH